MSDSNQFQVSFVEETTEGTTPNSAFQAIAVNGGSWPPGLETVRSKQLRTDKQLADIKRVGAGSRVTLPFELAGAALDDLAIEGALRADWPTAVNISASDISAAAADNSYNGSAGMNTNVLVGGWVFVAGFATAANNGWKRVVSATSTKLIVTGGTLSNESAGLAVTIKGSTIRNGTTDKFYSLQAQNLDLTNRYLRQLGSRVDSLDLNFQVGAIIDGSLVLVGRGITEATAKAGNGSVSAASTNDVISAADGFGSVWIDNAVSSIEFTKISLSLRTPTRPRKKLGSVNPVGIGQGALALSASLEMYLDDTSKAQLAQMLAFTKFGLGFDLTDGGGRRYHIELPQLAYTGEPGNAPGLDSDTMLSFSCEADPGSTFDKTIQITRI